MIARRLLLTLKPSIIRSRLAAVAADMALEYFLLLNPEHVIQKRFAVLATWNKQFVELSSIGGGEIFVFAK